MKYVWLLIFFIALSCSAVQAETLYSSVRAGVDLYEKQQYEEALKLFLDAQVENPESAVLKFDIASCQYKLQKYEDAAMGYLDVVATAQDVEMETKALYNSGNAMYRQGKLKDAVEYYKQTLELDPVDEDARKNLEFVREEIKRRMNEARDTQKRQQEGQKDQQDQQQDKQKGQQDQKQGQQDQQDQQDGQQKDQQEEGQQQGQADSQKQNEQQGSEKSESDNGQEPQQQQGQGSSAGEQDEDMQENAGQSNQKNGSQQAREDVRDSAGGDRPMSAEEAEQWLNGLEENREKLHQFRRRSQPGKSRRTEKNW